MKILTDSYIHKIKVRSNWKEGLENSEADFVIRNIPLVGFWHKGKSLIFCDFKNKTYYALTSDYLDLWKNFYWDPIGLWRFRQEPEFYRSWCSGCARCCDYDDCYFDKKGLCWCCKNK